ncbi:uncharacterized protein LOC144870363 [Branchiostoma floridae x Branchiostoma japonicum]
MPEGGKKKEKKKHLASDSDKGENSGRKRGTSPDERPKKYLALAAELSARGLPAQHARENLAKEGREGDGSSVEGDDSARRSKSPHVPHGEGEKSPPMPVLDPEARDKEVELNGTESPFPFPPGFDAAGFLQWLRKNLTTQESTPSVAASTSRTGVVGSGRKQPGNLEDGECSEEADSSESEKDEAHSTRGASTSAAAAAGVSVASIMKAADWARESTFQRFYRRESDQASYGQAVLSTALESA